MSVYITNKRVDADYKAEWLDAETVDACLYSVRKNGVEVGQYVSVFNNEAGEFEFFTTSGKKLDAKSHVVAIAWIEDQD